MTTGQIESLAGRMILQPGQAEPFNLRNTRRNWISMLAPGRNASGLPALVAGLYSLCGRSHQICAGMALAAARGESANAPGDAQAVQFETASEHVRRIGLEWPALLAGPGRAADAGNANWRASLRQCPLFVPEANPQSPPWPGRMLAWLKKEWLGMDARQWLDRWQSTGPDWLGEWSAQRLTGLARLLHDSICLLSFPSDCETSGPEVMALGWTDDSAHRSFSDLADRLLASDQFALAPRQSGCAAQTGNWTRHNDPDPLLTQPYELLGSRLADLIRLCLPDRAGAGGSGWLARGAISTGPLGALAWLEMARGLLIHAVRLDPADPDRVLAYQILAPTEWNFHPDGIVAQHLSRMDPAHPKTDPQVALLMAAYDPCVPFSRMPASAQNTVGSDNGVVMTARGQHA